jgi:signal transduction histidine kinase
VAGALLLVVGPWVWQLAVERDAERTARIRTDERAEVAARVHDSVLQTLALIQRSAEDPKRIAALARRQERELRGWLYGDGVAPGETLVGALEEAAAEIEETHGVRVELASGGDCPLDGRVAAVVLAAREAMQNAAKFAGTDEVSVYAEADERELSVFVRDRGAGFDRTSVPADRRGLVESIEGRLLRAGGRATIASTPGEGTEVELRLPRTE